MPQRAWSVRNLSYEKRAVNDPSGGWELEGKGVSCHSDVFRLYLTASLFGPLTRKYHRLGGLNSLRLKAPDEEIWRQWWTGKEFRPGNIDFKAKVEIQNI